MGSYNEQAHKKRKPSLGVLKLHQGESKFKLTRHEPANPLAFFVQHYWIIQWDLMDNTPHVQEVIPNPCVNLVFEKNRSGIFGVRKFKSIHQIEGRGVVFGVKFKPGGFFPFLKSPVSVITNESIRIKEIFGGEVNRLEEHILSQSNQEKMIKIVDCFLQEKLPQEDDKVTLVNNIIAKIYTDPEIVKVETICELFSMNIRKVQRLFKDYVGVSPKWVIRLYRLQQAAEKMDQSEIENFTQLAYDLGYFDQAHFNKDFKNFIGISPQTYMKHN